jgi:hypothetical protein
MATWKITPKYKKSISDVQYYTKDDNEIVYIVYWRWGEFYLETSDDNPPDIDLDGDIDLMNCGYDMTDFSTEDGISEDYDFSDCDDETAKEVQEFLEENSIYELEEQGWSVTEAEMWIECEMEIEKVA